MKKGISAILAFSILFGTAKITFANDATQTEVTTTVKTTEETISDEIKAKVEDAYAKLIKAEDNYCTSKKEDKIKKTLEYYYTKQMKGGGVSLSDDSILFLTEATCDDFLVHKFAAKRFINSVLVPTLVKCIFVFILEKMGIIDWF